LSQYIIDFNFVLESFVEKSKANIKNFLRD